MNTLNELEKLKPEVQKKIDDLNRKHTYHTNGLSYLPQNPSLEWPPIKKQSTAIYGITKVHLMHHINMLLQLVGADSCNLMHHITMYFTWELQLQF